MSPSDRRRKPSPRVSSPLGSHSRSPHLLIDNWLAERPDIRGVLDRLQGHIAAGAVSREDVLLLARKWRDTLPPRRGVVKQLSDFMQLKLGLDLAAVSRKRPRRRRRRNGRRPLL
jgi:hypothetical protein